MAKQATYDPGHIKDVGSQLWRSLSQALGEKVTKNNLHGVLRRAAQQHNGAKISPSLTPHIDWGEATDVSRFYGRTSELETLSQWIMGDSPKGDSYASRTRLITLLLHGHSNRVFCVAFSPNGQFLASGSADRTIKLWSPHIGKCLNTLHGHASWVWAIAFSPDSNLLASASHDHTIKIWDVHSGECWQTLQGHPGSVLAIAFSADGKTLFSCGHEKIVKQWDVETGKCLNIWEADPTGFGQLPSVQTLNTLPLVVMSRQSNCGTFTQELVRGYSKDIAAKLSVFCSLPMVTA